MAALPGAGPAQPLASPTPDPDLEPGWPVQTYETSGTYRSGPALGPLIGTVGTDPRPRIMVTGLANGPLYAWYADGQPVPGGSLAAPVAPAYPALGTLGGPGLSLAATFFGVYNSYIGAFNADGSVRSGWLHHAANYTTAPPVLGDVDGDGIDELFVDEEDWYLHAYRADGTVLPGWPQHTTSGQFVNMPALADLDGDGRPEIIAAGGWSTGGTDLYAWHGNGQAVSGFPVHFPDGFAKVQLAIGDVDGDGQLEIVVPSPVIVGGNPTSAMQILSTTGQVERTMILTLGGSNRPVPVLADLDGDNIPEIVVGTEAALYAFRGDGTLLPGWPQSWPLGSDGNTMPAVGDLDGDGHPDIAMTTGVDYTPMNGSVRVFNRNGQLLPHFPKLIPSGTGMDPAIADVDGDGRNELILAGTPWDGAGGWMNKVWLYDLHGAGPYGRVEWGQLGGNAAHTGLYLPARPYPTATPVPPTPTITPTPTPCTTGVFSDVQPTDYFAPAVQYLAGHGILSGYSDCTFRPYSNATRGQLTKIIVGAMGWPLDTSGGPHFSDVAPGSTFYGYIETAVHHGILGGYSDGTFRPGNLVTRGQLCKILVGAEAWPLLTPPAPHFTDVPADSVFYAPIETAYSHGILGGYSDGTFRPSNPATRGQIAKLIYGAILAPTATATPSPSATATATDLPGPSATATTLPSSTATPTDTALPGTPTETATPTAAGR
jgi:hypothetical protein